MPGRCTCIRFTQRQKHWLQAEGSDPLRVRPLPPGPGQDGTVETEQASTGPAAGAGENLSGLSRRQLLRLAARAPDSYGLLLVLLIADYVVTSINWSGGDALFARSALYLATILLAFHASRVGRKIRNAIGLFLILIVLTALAVGLAGGDTASGVVTLLVSVLLVAAPVAIGWRILHHQRVSAETIAGAVCIYVMIGMIFANLDYGLQLASGRDFFAQSGQHGLADFSYFSYITMATVGYGDLTPATGLPRTLSVLDALTGQVFLVVLLARLVSMYGGPRGWRQGLEERVRDTVGPAAPSGPPDA
jgi:Ion channel